LKFKKNFGKTCVIFPGGAPAAAVGCGGKASSGEWT